MMKQKQYKCDWRKNKMSGAEWIAIIGGITGLVGGCSGIYGLFRTKSLDVLKLVLELESQINQREIEFNKATACDKSDDYYLAMKEGYFNALDRLCFCIRKGYIPKKEWEREYRNMIKSVIAKKEFKDDFDPNSSPYKNMIKLNDEWQDSIVK